jgi:SAM-dependent methyltransferase
MQTPVCPLCKEQDSEERFSERGFKVFGCRVCGLFFIDPYPLDVDQYDRVSEYDYEELEILDPESAYQAQILFYKKYFPLIEQECRDAKSILDVGCGAGHLLERLGALPHLFRVGIELNAARAKVARRVAGCEIFQTPIEVFSSEEKFDVITVINVLSHIPAFDTLFDTIRSLLRDNGKLILKVGEMPHDVRKGDIWAWGIPDHLHFLGFDTLSFISHKYGFKISKHQRIPLSQEFFSRDKWEAPGRSVLRNAIKRIVVKVPFALPFLARAYDFTRGRTLYSSFVVMTRL